MKEREKAYVGDMIEITEPGQRYSNYTDFFDKFCPAFRDGYDDSYEVELRKGLIGTIVFADYNHKPTGGHDMYVFEPETSPGMYYLVNRYAFEICEMMKSPLIEIDEADMMSLFEVISCR